MSAWGGRQTWRDEVATLRKVAKLRALVYSTYPHICRVCTQPIDATLDPRHPLGPSVGHVTPRSRGGTDDLTNLRPEHLECNVGLAARPLSRAATRDDADLGEVQLPQPGADRTCTECGEPVDRDGLTTGECGGGGGQKCDECFACSSDAR